MATEAEITSMVQAEQAKGVGGDQALIKWGIDKIESMRNPSAAALREEFAAYQKAAQEQAEQQQEASKLPLMDAYFKRCQARCEPKAGGLTPRRVV